MQQANNFKVIVCKCKNLQFSIFWPFFGVSHREALGYFSLSTLGSERLIVSFTISVFCTQSSLCWAYHRDAPFARLISSWIHTRPPGATVHLQGWCQSGHSSPTGHSTLSPKDTNTQSDLSMQAHILGHIFRTGWLLKKHRHAWIHSHAPNLGRWRKDHTAARANKQAHIHAHASAHGFRLHWRTKDAKVRTTKSCWSQSVKKVVTKLRSKVANEGMRGHRDRAVRWKSECQGHTNVLVLILNSP